MQRAFWIVLLAGLLLWALRNAPLADIGRSLRQLTILQLMALLALNAVTFGLLTARWWLIVRAESRAAPFGPLLIARLTAFGISYFTPGPQVGGEPYQVRVLQTCLGLSAAHAVAAVVMDKLLEFLANFIFLAVGLFALARSGILAQISAPPALALALIALLLWPPIHILLLTRRRYPLSALLLAGWNLTGWPINIFGRRDARMRALRLLRASEHLAGRFCQRRLNSLLAALGVSLLAWIGMFGEYVLMAAFLRLPLSPLQSLAALTLARIAFLAPLPAGLGALEASQVFALTALGLPAAAAISLSLLMRARDLLLGGLGLALGMKK